MGDVSHAKIATSIDRLLSDPMTQLAMRADGVDPEALNLLLSRSALGCYSGPPPRAFADGSPDYRPSVGIALFNRDGRVFLGRRCDVEGEAWQMPQGGIDPGETAEQAARRELLEEIGTDDVILLGERAGWVRYDLPRSLVGRAWGGFWRGQDQRWLAMGYLGRDEDIDVHTAHPEFCEWRWAELEEARALIVDFKRVTYDNVTRAFAPISVMLSVAAPGSAGCRSWPSPRSYPGYLSSAPADGPGVERSNDD